MKQVGVNEVQTITVTATGGNYKLDVTCRGETKPTANIPFGSNGAAITAAVVALSNVEPVTLWSPGLPARTRRPFKVNAAMSPRWRCFPAHRM